MPNDKSLWFYGSVYHHLFDRPLAEGRQRAADLVAPGSSVVDVACGTGELGLALGRKKCRVVGIDLSQRMLEFAQRHCRVGGVTFQHRDATDLSVFGDREFDYAALLFLVHELTREQQLLVLTAAARVAGKVIVADAAAPLVPTRSDPEHLFQGPGRHFSGSPLHPNFFLDIPVLWSYV